MQLVGYSNPSKRHLEPKCNIIVGKIIAKNRRRHAQRGGVTLALLNVLVVRIVRVLRCNPGCLIYQTMTSEEQSIITHAYQMQCTNT